MFNVDRVDLVPEDGVRPQIPVALYHVTRAGAQLAGGEPRTPVLLLHGASANHRTFTHPNGSSLAEWLLGDFDPWLLDWRGSGLVVDADEASLKENGAAYNFNAAAQHDVPRAIQTIRQQTGGQKIAALGFCMGAAVLAEAIALEYVTAAEIDRVVLMTLGLFYEASIDGRLKCEDRILEHLRRMNDFLSIDPRVDQWNEALKTPWPRDLDTLYERWPSALKSHAEDANETRLDPVNHMCNRLSFMYGMPYHHHNLADEIHGALHGKPLLPDLFGPIPLHMFIHGARNLRRGRATFYENDDRRDEEFVSAKARKRFCDLEKVTLITGGLNRLWHRDSIDRMHEWLSRGHPNDRKKFVTRIFQGYGHQDLLWGRSSVDVVFPAIKTGLSA